MRKYLSAAKVKARYDGISDMTLWRWLNEPPIDSDPFPQPERINGRRYWPEEALDEWDAKRAEKTASTQKHGAEQAAAAPAE